MSITRKFTTEVTITEPGAAETRYGDAASDFDSPSAVTQAKGWLVQSTSTEEIGGRDVSVTVWILMLPADTPVSSVARVTAGEKVFDVDGEPNVRDYGLNPHVSARLRFVAEVVPVA